MKKLIITSLVLAYTLLLSCGTSAQETQNTDRSITMLIDCTAENLFNDIDRDIRANLPNFMQSTGIASITFLQSFTAKIGFVESTGDLSLTKESISLPQSNKVSNRKANELRNPQPILNMIDKQLVIGKAIAANKQTKSPIVEVILKSMRELSPETDETVMLFSDGVEYSDAANFYKSIPFSDETFEKYYAKLDPFILQEATSKIASIQPTVVFYLKTSEEGINKANLKRFYSKFFEKIGVKNYMFLDNLTQNVQSFNVN